MEMSWRVGRKRKREARLNFSALYISRKEAKKQIIPTLFIIVHTDTLKQSQTE